MGVPPHLLFPLSSLAQNGLSHLSTGRAGTLGRCAGEAGGRRAVGRGRLARPGKAGWGWLSVRGMREGLGYPQPFFPRPRILCLTFNMIIINNVFS